MAQAQDETAANKALVLSYMKASQSTDREQMAQYLAEDAVRVFPRPGGRSDPNTVGRDNIIGNIPHTAIYEPGTMRSEIENIIAEGPFVAVQFVLRATTARGEPYENFYLHVFECHDGKITKYHEYLDTLYGARMLRPELLGAP